MGAVGVLEGTGLVVKEAEDTLEDKEQPNKKEDNDIKLPVKSKRINPIIDTSDFDISNQMKEIISGCAIWCIVSGH